MRSRCITAALILAFAPSALAQGTIGGTGTGTTTGDTINVLETNDQDNYINIAECSGNVQDRLLFTWTYQEVITGVSGTYTLTLSDTAGCPSTGKNQVYTGIDASTSSGSYPGTGQNQVNVPQLMQTLNISCSGGATAVYVCVSYLPSSGSPVTNALTTTIPLDLGVPPKPVIDSVTPGDGALNIAWEAGSGGTGTSRDFDVVVTAHDNPQDTRTQTVVAAFSTRVGGLQNNVLYDIVIYAFSPGGNESDASDSGSGTPVFVNDFWRLYKADGGRELGGCATGGTGLAALLGLVPLAWRRRRAS